MSEREVRNVVVLGAGYAGLSASHYFMKHVYPSLKTGDKSYKLHLVDQSTHFWWHLTAPRSMVKTNLMPHSKTFSRITDGFDQYGADKSIIRFHQAQPTSVDLERRIATLKNASIAGSTDADSKAQTADIEYYALIIATGTKTPTAATSYHGGHEKSIAALDDLSTRLSTATSVVIGGGGPIGVETAGEVGELLNGSAGWLQSRPANPRVKVTLVAGKSRLLTVLRPALADKAVKMLERVGVNVLFNTRVSTVDVDDLGKSTVHLDNGEKISADVYIPATGTTPNTEFLPEKILTEKRYVHTNAKTLRVDSAGDRVYALGDVGDYTRGGVLECANAAPVFGGNFARDMGVTSAPRADREFKGNWGETQLVPVGSKQGVGAFSGWAMPSIVVKNIKGKDYFVSHMANFTEGKGVAKA